MASRPTRKRFDPGELSTHGCSTGKIAHLTKRAAFDVAELMMQRGQVEPGCHLTPVYCALCGLWHVANYRIVPKHIVDGYLKGTHE